VLISISVAPRGEGIERRPFNQLAAADHGWLKAKHHFSFGEHARPTRMGSGALRVWNDNEIAPNTGFPPHPHANMPSFTERAYLFTQATQLFFR
jgi:redox-sensitive bicupin YhaK (pirin superfamily)